MSLCKHLHKGNYFVIYAHDHNVKQQIASCVRDRLCCRDLSFSAFINYPSLQEIQSADEPEVDEEGNPLLHRTTAVHVAARRRIDRMDPQEDRSDIVIDRLFAIYNKFNVNYIDEYGLSHFHVACLSGCEVVVEKFLEFGQDPNFLWRETGYSPLDLALGQWTPCNWSNEGIFQSLLQNGANPNVINRETKRTPLHIIIMQLHPHSRGQTLYGDDFQICHDKHRPVQFNLWNILGWTPLHCAVNRQNRMAIELLLKNGADPNAVDEDGYTPLHACCFCFLYDYVYLLKQFFEINDKLQKTVHVNAVDNKGRTPLKLAVEHLFPDAVDIFLDRVSHVPKKEQYRSSISSSSSSDCNVFTLVYLARPARCVTFVYISDNLVDNIIIFIEERLHMLNSGLGFSDEFEMEACNYSDKSGNKFMQQYREWTYAMRKEGSAFIRSVKDRANPAVKSAVKSVERLGAIIFIITIISRDRHRARRLSTEGRYRALTRRPRSRRADSRLPAAIARSCAFVTFNIYFNRWLSNETNTYKNRYGANCIFLARITSRKQYSPLSPSSPEEQDCSPPPARLDIDLMHELRDVIFPNTPPVDRSKCDINRRKSIKLLTTNSPLYLLRILSYCFYECRSCFFLTRRLSPRITGTHVVVVDVGGSGLDQAGLDQQQRGGFRSAAAEGKEERRRRRGRSSQKHEPVPADAHDNGRGPEQSALSVLRAAEAKVRPHR
ncbi:unnamed protein product [Trichogramma brassicae]|uniref:Uncharacterized protein n=1 Tax=Trichogramma brassicae TaxID=86971 RepID=A0A6H5IHN9_9HYME|nr:unnamed protein product [Trichogramma brassicae]